MEITSTFCVPDITDSWREQEEPHSKYTYRCNAECNILSIIPDAVGVVASVLLQGDVISWRQLKTTGGTLPEKVNVRLLAQANNRILASDHPASHMMNTETSEKCNRFQASW
jgi:hypothetical protein